MIVLDFSQLVFFRVESLQRRMELIRLPYLLSFLRQSLNSMSLSRVVRRSPVLAARYVWNSA